MIRVASSNRGRDGRDCTALAVAAAAAEEAPAPSRAEYVAKLEGICKPGLLPPSARCRGCAPTCAPNAWPSPPPSSPRPLAFSRPRCAKSHRCRVLLADRATLARWFGYLAQEESNLHRIVAVLRADRPVAFQHASARFVTSGERADNVVLAFGFNYCYFKLSRFE